MPKTESNPIKKLNLQDSAVALIIFELDFTLWPFSVGTKIIPPFTKLEDKSIRDSIGSVIQPYNHIERILRKICENKIKIAIVSRTEVPQTSNQLLNELGWKRYIDYFYIYHQGQKVHFVKKLRKKSGIEYTKMISFENKEQDMADVQGLGVHCVLLKEGLNMQNFTEAIENFALYAKS